MRFIKKQLSLWSIVLIIGVAVIGIVTAARVSPTEIAVVTERQDYLAQQPTAVNEDADAKDRKSSKAAVGKGVVRQQDDYYERRREYWDRRIERRLEDNEEYLDEQTADDNNADSKDSKSTTDKKDSKVAADDEVDADATVDNDVKAEQDVYERRREYWRQRLEREW
jgi:hypothetical protein